MELKLIIGLPFNTYTGQIYESEQEILNNLNNLDGCFRIIHDDKIITDTNGFFPNYYDIQTKSLLNNFQYDYSANPYILIPDISIFSLSDTVTKSYYHIDIIDDIFTYFEDWFVLVYSNLIKKYNVCLSISTGLDSRYLLAIIQKNNLPYKLSTWGLEGKNASKYFDIDYIIDTSKYKQKYLKQYLNYYSKCNYQNWNEEYNPFIYYSKMVQNTDVIIEGLGRNFYTSKPRIFDSPDIYRIKRTFSCGRVPLLIDNQIRAFYPYSCKNIRWNIRRLNLSEKEITEKIASRIKYLSPKLMDIPTDSFKKADKYDTQIKKEYSILFTAKY